MPISALALLFGYTVHFLAFYAPGLALLLVLRRRSSNPIDESFLLSGVIVQCLVGYLTLIVFFVSPTVGYLLGVAWIGLGLLLTLVHILKCGTTSPLLSVPLRSPLIVSYLMGLMHLGVLGSVSVWEVQDELRSYVSATQVNYRFAVPHLVDRGVILLTLDNQIPSQLLSLVVSRDIGFQETILQGKPVPRIMLSSQTSERPPLLTGILLLHRPILDGLPIIERGWHAQIHGTIAQSAWGIALWSLLVAAGTRRNRVGPLIAWIALSSFGMLQALYLWPKLLAGALTLACAQYLWIESAETRPPYTRALLAGLSAALAFLAHGGSGFILLALGIALVPKAFGLLRSHLGACLVGGAVCVSLLLPWESYRRFCDPPGDYLLKLHFAGLIERTEEPALSAILHEYGKLTFWEWLELKWYNARVVLGLVNPETELGFPVDMWVGWRYRDNSHLFFTLGLVQLAISRGCLKCGMFKGVCPFTTIREVIPMKSRAYRSVAVNRVSVPSLIEGRDGQAVHVGLDIGKESIFGILRWNHDDFSKPIKVANPREVMLLVKLLLAVGKDRVMTIAMEPTGTYGDALRQALCDAGLSVRRVSTKAAKDYSEIFDGVPSQHDGKDAAIVSELSALGRSWDWPYQPGTPLEQEMSYWIDTLNIQRRLAMPWIGKLEGLLSRHWPEACEHTHINAGMMLRLLQHNGGPAKWVADPNGKQLALKWGGSFTNESKVQALQDSGRETVGVRMTPWDEQRTRDCASHLIEYRRVRRATVRKLKALCQDHPVIQAQAQVVGLVTACVIYDALGDPKNYPSGEAYRKAMGLNLTEWSSGKYQGKLAISKRGSSEVRRYLCLAAWRSIRRYASVSTWYKAQKEKRQGVGQPAVIGVMRKLSIVLHLVGAKGVAFSEDLLFPSTRQVLRTNDAMNAKQQSK